MPKPLEAGVIWPTTALPEIKTAGRFALDDRGYDTAYRSETHVLHVHMYHGTIRLAGRDIALRPGDCTFSPAGSESSYDLPTPGHHWCVHFVPAPSLSAETKVTLPLHLPLGSLAEHAGQRIMMIAHMRVGGPDPIATAVASAAMLELLLWIALQARMTQRSPRTASAPDASRGIAAVERAATLLHERLAEPLSITDIADEVELTQNYLARLFRLRHGMTMPRFLLTCRMDHARHLLSHTSMPIARVAARSGIPDIQHFNKQFRRLIGMSPSAYRGQFAATGRVVTSG